jgi:hypothetical protein
MWARLKDRLFRSNQGGAMKAHGRQVLAAVTLLAISGIGCGEEEKNGNHQIWFMGSVFDGASGAGITGYEISLVSGPTTIRGKVDGNGRYLLGPLPAWNDYGVTISAPGFRGFASYNAGIAPPPPPAAAQASDIYNSNTTQTFNFDAYLFPDGIPVPAVTVTVTKPDTTAPLATGSIRLRPTTLPSIQDQTAGVGSQVWSNDQDILAAVYSNIFADGSIVIDGASLVYGVSYQVTVYDVAGFAPFQSPTGSPLRAGSQETFQVPLTPSAPAVPLMLTGNNITACRAVGASTTVTSTAQITLTFNVPIEDATAVPGGAEMLDNGLTVSTSLGATLKSGTASTLVQERGTSFMIGGNTLQISWNAAAGILTQFSGDIITSVSYGNLASISLRPVGQTALAKTLSVLLNGQSSIPCNTP